ncbi:hypothetical protein ACVWWN_004330 [Mycobacterium sp. URHB0021]
MRGHDHVAARLVSRSGGEWRATLLRRNTIHYGFVVLAILALLGTLILATLMFSTASDPNTEGIGVGIGPLWLMWGGMWTSYGPPPASTTPDVADGRDDGCASTLISARQHARRGSCSRESVTGR